ncbi:TrkH family potassium uptake protein [Cellvibrio sp. PSBB006]|jgi:trk system potassium uptake protein TrkH|uniref:TrkH family potassium uptake protein n=1 Tax=Cellvibrio sp. PSBB006 TaxID=1987723 RepID=UPI000B3B69CB|nr:TrkH family potassium uptake protein [Cellvibrio sp. PSBB006]ARU28380.1 potassium transporter [Cellvibrio sp. PSBB006]
MNFAIIARVLGVLLTLFSLTLLVPIAISLWFDDHNYMTFLLAFAITFAAGIGLWLPARTSKADLRTRDGFLITALFWSVLSTFGTLPLILSDGLTLSFTDAMFEAVSGLTTTGATVISGLDQLPPSILYYRHQLQWFGGIGIIVIAVAILPMLGIGGMQLYRAEAPGPVKDNKLTPRITETAKALFLMYLVLTITCGVAYWLAGMNWFEALCHAFSTVANGGFSTHDDSIRYFDSSAILLICSIFMLISGANFALHFFVWREKSLHYYFADAEFRFYFGWIAVGTLVTVSYLYFTHTYDAKDSFVIGFFNLASTLSTAGFAADFVAWPSFLPFALFILAFLGGCASSTGGGMKMIRVLLLYKQGIREIHRLIFPNAVIPIKVGRINVSDRVVEAVWGFFAMYVVMYILMFLLLLMSGLDLVTSFSAVGACITNLGPGMGEVASNYSSINAPAKWVLCFAMLLGRLEVFTLLVLFSPMFWRR